MDWNEAPEIMRKHLVTATPQSYGYRASHRLYRPNLLTLGPGQVVEAPAALGAAVMIVVEFALETMLDIVDPVKTMFD